MLLDRNISDIDREIEREKSKAKAKNSEITGRDMLALTVAAYQVLLPFLGLMLLSYGGVILLFKLLIR